MAEQFLYLTTKGRTSGEPRQIEIWFAEHAGRHYLVSEKREESNWVKNIERDPKVTYSIGTRDAPQSGIATRQATARVVRPNTEPDLEKTVAALMHQKYQWSDGLIVELTPQ